MYIIFLLLIITLNLQFSLLKPFHLYNNDVIYKNKLDGKGNYEFDYKTQARRIEDYITRNETGKIEKTDSGEEVLRVKGSYEFHPVCDEGITVYYTADENGFKARIVQSSNKKYTKMDGIIVGVMSVCPVVGIAPIGGACLASLQGACAGK